ncbi:hypothetical protein JB92DRAFT_3025750 [Gautieria morchelliformis]|nr:hypothetical protein JB92DRAFT_3025750 [Gautieria morchelliformis]
MVRTETSVRFSSLMVSCAPSDKVYAFRIPFSEVLPRFSHNRNRGSSPSLFLVGCSSRSQGSLPVTAMALCLRGEM